MKYYPDKAKVIYKSKYGKEVKEFSCPEWMAALVSHIPDRGGRRLGISVIIVMSPEEDLKKKEMDPGPIL